MSFLLAAAAIVSAGQTFTCTPTRVWDGDGPLWCAEGARIRLAGIATREIDNTCRAGQPCPDASGTAARDGLVRLVGEQVGRSSQGHILVRGPVMRCVANGKSHERTTAWCVSPKGGDLSCAMVQSGLALPWYRFWKDHRCTAS